MLNLALIETQRITVQHKKRPVQKTDRNARGEGQDGQYRRRDKAPGTGYSKENRQELNILMAEKDAMQRHITKNSKHIFPETEMRDPSPNFHIHVSVSDLYIPMIRLPIMLQEDM